MSVYKRTYRPYTGQLTSNRTRFGVLMRYAFSDVWHSRVTNVLFVLCLVPSVIWLAVIYIANNDTVRTLLGPTPPLPMDQTFFLRILQTQCWLALGLTAWIGPRLISVDVANNALPTLLSHPISRAEYVFAKFSLLMGFLSAVTWMPILLMFAFQSHVSATPWAMDHLFIAAGAFVGALIWITVLSLVALSLASWVKWRIVATGMVFAAMFVPAGMGGVFNAVMRTNWGHLINVPFMMMTLWRRLLQVSQPSFYTRLEIPTISIIAALVVICAACVAALNARIRAREVVRG